MKFLARRCVENCVTSKFAKCPSARAIDALFRMSFSTFDGVHPVIDVSPILTSYHPERGQTIQDLGNALKERGYFYAQNVNLLSADYLSFIYDYSERLHSLPTDVKRRFSQQSGHGAYSGADIGEEELAYDPNTTASVHAWDYSRTQFTLKKEEDGGDSDGSDKNIYPDSSIIEPPFVEVLDELYERQNVLGSALMIAFAEYLDLESNTFVDMFHGKMENQPNLQKYNFDLGEEGKGDFGTIRLLYYPGLDSHLAEKANVGISAHTDFEAFTLMHQSAPGLQFLPPRPLKAGETTDWVDAPVREGEFVVIVGDAIERVTNGLFKATPHRVIKTPHPRRSIIRFNAFAGDTMLEPMAKFITKERPAQYTSVTMKKHMEVTMRNLGAGIGAWDDVNQKSLTANYVYINGEDHEIVDEKK